MLINDLALLLDQFGNSEGTKLLIWTVIFCLAFTAPAKWRVELRAKIGHYRNRCFERTDPILLWHKQHSLPVDISGPLETLVWNRYQRRVGVSWRIASPAMNGDRAPIPVLKLGTVIDVYCHYLKWYGLKSIRQIHNTWVNSIAQTMLVVQKCKIFRMKNCQQKAKSHEHMIQK